MILWRIAKHASLDGAGGLLVSGRWHTKGHPVIYCSLNPATCLLETMVHFEIDSEDRPDHFQLIQISVPDKIIPESISSGSLPRKWERDQSITQSIGDQWLASNRSLLLEVPSVLAPETWNVLINPAHKQARLLKIAKIYQHPFDTRLL